MVKHQLAASGYNDRRRECEEALEILRRAVPELPDLRACTMEMLAAARPELGDVRYRRALHQVEENQRVLDAEKALAAGNAAALGKLMAESHASLSRNFEVSSPEQDFLAAAALEKGAPGARMTGGGFGGNVICLVHRDQAEGFARSLAEAYQQAFGRDAEFMECRPADGAGVEALQEAVPAG